MSLTDREIKALKPEKTRKKYFYGDGNYIEVDPNWSKWRRLKYRFNGQERRISLGVYPEVSLKDARETARSMKEDL